MNIFQHIIRLFMRQLNCVVVFGLLATPMSLTYAEFLVPGTMYQAQPNSPNMGNYVHLDASRMLASNTSTHNGSLVGSIDFFLKDDADGWHHQQRIEPPYDMSTELGLTGFGNFSVYEDYLLIGSAWADMPSYIDAGKTFLYRYEPASKLWQLEYEFSHPEPVLNGGFGLSPQMSGNTIAIGSAKSPTTGSSDGLVYLFRYDSLNDTWTLAQTIHAPSLTSGTFFSERIKFCGDDLLIKAFNIEGDPEGPNIETSGVYVYRQDAYGDYAKQQLLIGDAVRGGVGDNSSFGVHMLCDDERLLIEDAYEKIEHDLSNIEDEGNGTVYFFIKDQAGVWMRQQKIISPYEDSLHSFFRGVSMDGNTMLVSELVHWLSTPSSLKGPSSYAVHLYQYDTHTQLWRWHQTATPNDLGKKGVPYVTLIYDDDVFLLGEITTLSINGTEQPYFMSYDWLPDNAIDLALSVTTTTQSVTVGERFTIEYSVSNLGTDTANDVVVEEGWATVFEIQDIPVNCGMRFTVLACTLGAIAPAETVKLSVSYLIPEGYLQPNLSSRFVNYGAVNTSQGEQYMRNNVAAADITVEGVFEPIDPYQRTKGSGGAIQSLLILVLLVYGIIIRTSALIK